MAKKVDKGFELFYWKLSYRRKFIRTLFFIPCFILIMIICQILLKNIFFTVVYSLFLVISLIIQLTYNYKKWEEEEQDLQSGKHIINIKKIKLIILSFLGLAILLVLIFLIVFSFFKKDKEEILIEKPIDLIGSNISGLSKFLVGGIYRFQGVDKYAFEDDIELDEDIVDNYICFGTHSKEKCLDNTDRYMYRIIGIDTKGRMKLIKESWLLPKVEGVDWRFRYSYVSYKWSDSDVENTLWEDSLIYSKLNGDGYLNDKYYFSDDIWIDKIIDYEWKYGTMSKDEIGMDEFNFYDGDYYFDIENKWEKSVVAKIGLISVSDYYYAATKDRVGLFKGYPLYYTDILDRSWLGRIDVTIAAGIDFDRYYTIQVDYTNSEKRAKPVFWINSDIVFSSGNGKEDSPFVIK